MNGHIKAFKQCRATGVLFSNAKNYRSTANGFELLKFAMVSQSVGKYITPRCVGFLLLFEHIRKYSVKI